MKIKKNNCTPLCIEIMYFVIYKEQAYNSVIYNLHEHSIVLAYIFTQNKNEKATSSKKEEISGIGITL